MLEWDEAKRIGNFAKHGVDFPAAALFEFETAIVTADTRAGYGEVRLVAVGFMGPRVHVLVFTIREKALRVISLRRANRREIEGYAKAIDED